MAKYDLSESMGLQANDRESWLATIWGALEEYSALSRQEETEQFADEWDDI